jgi:hypothetical protein
MNDPPLSRIQSWLMTVMTSAGGVEAGLNVAKERFGLDLEAIIAHGGGAAPATRLGIYASGYIMRLLECLRADFPTLRRLMGEPLFDFFAKSYIWAHPSTSPSLFDLGAGFPDFLARTQRPGTADGGADSALRLPIDLARLERARTQGARRARRQTRSPSCTTRASRSSRRRACTSSSCRFRSGTISRRSIAARTKRRRRRGKAASRSGA